MRSVGHWNLNHCLEYFRLPLPAEAQQALLAGEQVLHGALFEVALLGEELLQGLDEGIGIAQRLGDGFLLAPRRQGNLNSREILLAYICSNSTLPSGRTSAGL